MSHQELNFLSQLGERLGLDNATITKAKEYYRLSSNKPELKITDIPKSMICLDLAAGNTGAELDKAIAVQQSTLSNKKVYEQNYHLIEKCLRLNATLSISDICVKLNCSEVKELAETILQKYQESNAAYHDLSHPQYNTVAVFMACKLKNVKTTKSPFIQISQLKQTQWKQLESKFSEFIKTVGFDLEFSNSKKSKTQGLPDVEKDLQSKENNVTSSENEDTTEKFEDYEVWKARILKEAKQELAKKDKLSTT